MQSVGLGLMEELVAPLLCGVSSVDGGARAVPLTTLDLHLLLDRMQVRTEETKDRVFSTVKAHYKDFVELVGRASAEASKIEYVHTRVQALLDDRAFEAADPGSFDAKLWKLSSEVKVLRSELNLKRSALSLVKSIAFVREDFLCGKELFFQGNLVDGARKIAEADKVLGKNEGNALLMFVLLKRLRSDVYTEVESVLTSLFAEAVSANLTDGTLAVMPVTFAGARLKLLMILEAMELLGLLDEALNRFTDSVCKLFVVLIREPSLAVTVQEDSEQATLRMATCKTKEAKVLTVEEVYKRALLFLGFLHKHVVSFREGWMQKLGRTIWPRVADMVIQYHLRKAIPRDHTEFQDFEKIQTLTSQFENALHSENFIVLNEQGRRLSSFTSDIEVHFSANKRKKLLASARHLIVQFDYGLLVRSEEKDQLLLKEGNHGVSYLSKQLLSVVHETLKDACSSTPRIALELYKAARDVMFLFRAIVSLQFDKSRLEAAPFFYNDCLYIARELVNISEQYNSSLPAELRESCTFMDIVPLFQSMSTEVLSEQLKSVSTHLMEILDDANGFKSTDEGRQRETTRSALHQVVSVLQTVHVTWHECLPGAVEAKQLVSLTDMIIKRLLFEVLSIQDLAAEETVQLHNLLEELMQELRPVLKCVETSSHRRLESIVPSWRKLKCLSEILELSLKPITKAWESGSLSSAGFSAAEVKKLIKAIFTDTSLRAECLLRIV